jgi:HPt (histidine-containing phosphotransfer) domain-containing protein
VSKLEVLLDPRTRRSVRMRELFAEYAPKDLDRLKGGAYTFGAVRLGDAAAEIERIARSGDVPGAEPVAKLRETLEATLEKLASLPA